MSSNSSSGLDERELHVELGELGGAVGPGGLVAEAAGDLVVALEAGDDVELLVGLRRLRQRVELARVRAGRHQELARALGGRLVQDRRLELPEAPVLEVAADRLRELEAHPHVVAHLLAAQVEVAVAQPQRLVDALVVELERQRRGGREHLQPLDVHLDPAGVEARVHRLRRARAHDPLGLDDVLGPQGVGDRVGGGLLVGVEHELDDAGLVAQVDEDEPAVVAARGHPSGQGHPPALVARAQVAAELGAPLTGRAPRRDRPAPPGAARPRPCRARSPRPPPTRPRRRSRPWPPAAGRRARARA